MSSNGSTYWTMIESAAEGSTQSREQFAQIYLPIVTAYLRHRWKGSRLIGSVDDAAQEVFVECFKENGPLAKADRRRVGGFRPFLFGVSRNVARRFEAFSNFTKHTSPVDTGFLVAVASEDPSASILFDRVWAQAMVVRAVALQKTRAEKQGGDALRRVELLNLRFHENLPIREIATRWSVENAWLHHEYAKARQEFHDALVEVVHRHSTGSREDARKECKLLLEILR